MVLHIRVWESSTTPDLYLTPSCITVAPGMHKGVFLFRHYERQTRRGVEDVPDDYCETMFE